MKTIMAAILVVMTAFSSMAQTSITNPFPKTISVSGTAELEIVPDEIYVVVDLKEYEKKGSGKIDLEKIKADFLAKCRSIGLPDSVVTIASYEGYNNHPWWSKKKKKDEMYASIAYQIKFTNSKKIDELVEQLDDDATQNFQVVKTSHSKIREFRKQLKIQAIKAAKEKATYLAAAIDEQIGVAVSITEPDDITVIPYMNFQRQAQVSNYGGMATDAGGQAGIDFKKLKLQFEVKVVFALK